MTGCLEDILLTFFLELNKYLFNSISIFENMVLKREFYARDTKKVAIDLLGKILARKVGNKILKGKIVETEAYFGMEDPASRAHGGKKNLNVPMWSSEGKAFVYMVHGNWLFNIVTEREGRPSAVLIRSLEPIDGKDIMLKNRRKKNKNIGKDKELCSGPGKLTQALAINQSHTGVDVSRVGEIFIEDNKESFEVVRSHRIGVSKDLPEKLRFYIKGNSYISRK
jgi:DNA-3-methyladenine glycosylase